MTLSNNQSNLVIRTKCNSMDHHQMDRPGIKLFAATESISIINSSERSNRIIKQGFLFNFMFLLSISSFMVTFISMGAGAIVAMQGQQQKAPHVIAIKEGADLDLSCPIVVQNEDMIISWTCDNEPANIRSSRIHVTESGKLRIKSAKVGDACNYRCEAADGFGTLSMIVKVIIVDRRLRDRLSRTQNRTLSHNNHQPSADSTSSKSEYPSSGSDGLAALDLAEGGLMGSSSGGTVGVDGQMRFQQAQQSDFDVQVEPANLSVEKNRSFSLECSVKHPPHLKVPQIIWLKEYIGPEPNSISEAHEQNLVKIDDVYYHSLNWPRSVSHSKQTACVNSALLVRQSSFVHSGRYICFAGYPPSIVFSYNMSMISSTITPTTSDDNNNPADAPTMRQPLKYKMALAIVRVVNAENGKQKQLLVQQSDPSLVSALTSVPLAPISDKRPKNLLISIFSADSWIWNLIACLTLFCGLLFGLKLIYTRYYRLNNNTANGGNNNNNSIGCNNNDKSGPDEICRAISENNLADTPITQQQQQHFNMHQQPHRLLGSNLSTTLETSTLGINSTDCSQILSSGACLQLEERLMGLPQLDNESSDSGHLYSEIGERDKMIRYEGK